MKKLYVLFLLIICVSTASIPAMAQVINCPSGFSSSGSCGVSLIGGGGQPFAVVGSTNGSTPALSGSKVYLLENGYSHMALNMNYTPTVNVQAFTTTFTFVPNGQNFAFVLQNNTNANSGGTGQNFAAGASCEGSFYQGYATLPPSPNNIVALEFDSYSPLSGASFTYSSVQLYQANQQPCVPSATDDIPAYNTNKISTSPVPLTSPASTQGSSTGDTYSATLSYDGTNLSLCMYDASAATGSCSSGTSGTGTYFQQTWSAVDIPALVNGITAHLGFAGSNGVTATYPLYIDSIVYTVNSAPSAPSLSTYTTQSYMAGTTPAANPTFSPASGSYSGTQSVTLSCSTGSSNICYSSIPSLSSSTILPQTNNYGGCQSGTLYSGAITVSASETIYAMCGTTYASLPSNEVAAAYVINAAAKTSVATGKTTMSGPSRH